MFVLCQGTPHKDSTSPTPDVRIETLGTGLRVSPGRTNLDTSRWVTSGRRGGSREDWSPSRGRVPRPVWVHLPGRVLTLDRPVCGGVGERSSPGRMVRSDTDLGLTCPGPSHPRSRDHRRSHSVRGRSITGDLRPTGGTSVTGNPSRNVSRGVEAVRAYSPSTCAYPTTTRPSGTLGCRDTGCNTSRRIFHTPPGTWAPRPVGRALGTDPREPLYGPDDTRVPTGVPSQRGGGDCTTHLRSHRGVHEDTPVRRRPGVTGGCRN